MTDNTKFEPAPSVLIRPLRENGSPLEGEIADVACAWFFRHIRQEKSSAGHAQ
jgi:hypothetical protein